MSDTTGTLRMVNPKYLTEIEGMSSYAGMEIFVSPGDVIKKTVDCFTFVGNVVLLHPIEAVLMADYSRIREIAKSNDFLQYNEWCCF